MGTELATGGTPGQIPGTYDVTIRNERDAVIYTGELRITPAGEGFS